MNQQISVNSPILNFMRNHSVVVDLLYMDRFSKTNMCITKNFSFKGARNETALKTEISVPKRRVKNNTK
jgi:hypothetical protein